MSRLHQKVGGGESRVEKQLFLLLLVTLFAWSWSCNSDSSVMTPDNGHDGGTPCDKLDGPDPTADACNTCSCVDGAWECANRCVCTPGDRRGACNECVCNDEGTDWRCILIACNGDAGSDALTTDAATDGADANTVEGGAEADGPKTDEAGDAGADCSCTPDDAGAPVPLGQVSFACYCASLGRCPTYDDALDVCGGPTWHTHTLMEYAACNLTVINSNFLNFGGNSYVYDSTTHELVGAYSFSDVGQACGSGNVIGHRAGRFPDPSCARSKLVDLCAGDGGDDASSGGD